MTQSFKRITLSLLICAFMSLAADAAEQTIIDTRERSLLRYYEVTATDIARTKTGELVAVDPVFPRLIKNKKTGEWVHENQTTAKKGERKLRIAPSKRHGVLPPADWMSAGFDDSQWARVMGGSQLRPDKIDEENGFIRDYKHGETMSVYRGLALMCLRSDFMVIDPKKVSKLSLHMQFRGGAVVYLNGKEVARAHLPEGDLRWDTVAQDYPLEAFVDEEGALQYVDVDQHPHYYLTVLEWDWRKAEWAKQTPVRKRLRKLDISIPPAALQAGVNVLAIELHRAPAAEEMFTAPPYKPGLYWNRVSVERLLVSATAEDGAVAHNFMPPKNMYLSNHPVTQEIDYRIPNTAEELNSLQIQGVSGGSFSGVAVLNSPEQLREFELSCTDLQGQAGNIPATQIQVRYQKYSENTFGGGGGKIAHWFGQVTKHPNFHTLEASYEHALRDAVKHKAHGVLHKVPIWFLVDVPRNTQAGVYKGLVRISAQGQQGIEMPVQLEVLSNWQLPPSQKFKTFVAFNQSPETLAFTYNVDMWSEAHWQLIEESLRYLGQIGNKEVLVTFIPKTMMGNEHAMLRFIKDKNGHLKPDFSIVERYIALAAKHMGEIPSVCTIFDFGAAGNNYAALKKDRSAPVITVLDAETGVLSDFKDVPAWGTPEALAFWKPVMETYMTILQKHKVGPNPTMYWSQFCGVNKKAWTDLKQLIPGLQHMNRSHIVGQRGVKEIGKSRLYNAHVVRNAAEVLWDPDMDPHYYGWRHELDIIVCPREGSHGPGMREISYMSKFRQFPEACLLSGVGGVFAKRPERYYRAGFGQFGIDFWPVQWKDGGKPSSIVYRYASENSAGYIMKSLLGRGVEKPCASGRFQMLREGLQEAEARMYITDALLDQADKLGSDLAARCKRICDEQTRLHRDFSYFMNYGKIAPFVHWQKARELYQLAGEVQKALGE